MWILLYHFVPLFPVKLLVKKKEEGGGGNCEVAEGNCGCEIWNKVLSPTCSPYNKK